MTLESLGYAIERISISSLMHKLDDYSDIPTIPEDVIIDECMNVENKPRTLGKNNILSRFAIFKVWKRRMLHKGEKVSYLFMDKASPRFSSMKVKYYMMKTRILS